MLSIQLGEILFTDDLTSCLAAPLVVDRNIFNETCLLSPIRSLVNAVNTLKR